MSHILIINVGQVVLGLHKDSTVTVKVTHDTGDSHVKLRR